MRETAGLLRHGGGIPVIFRGNAIFIFEGAGKMELVGVSN